MRHFWVLGLSVLLLALGSCKKEERVGGFASEAPAVAPASPPAPDQAQTADSSAAESRAKAAPDAMPAANRAPAVPRKLIFTVDLRLEVRDTEKAAGEVQALVARLGGFVASSNARRQNELMHYQMTVRVPVQRLDEALAAIKALAVQVEGEQKRVEDVTDQYIDLDARVRTLEATEAELQALLAESRQRGRKVEEIMQIYRELVDIRSQIEQIRTQLNSFDKLASFSTVNLELAPTEASRPVAEGGWKPGDTARSSVRMLVSFLRALGNFLIYFVIVLVPIGLVVAAVVVLVRRVIKARRPPA